MLSFKEYQQNNAINASFLKACLQGSYQGYKYLYDKKEPSQDMIFGSALHHYILEQDSFYQHYAVMFKIDRRTKAGKEQAEAFWKTNSDKIIIDSDDLDKIIRISNNASKSETISNLLKQCSPEQSFFATLHDGYRYKARLDLVDLNSGVIVDIKTTRSADPEQFSKDFISYGYDIQMLHYSNMVLYNANLYGKMPELLIIAIEKDSEQIAIYDVTKICESSFTQNRYNKAINTAHEVLTLLECPNKYSKSIITLDLPRWIKEA